MVNLQWILVMLVVIAANRYIAEDKNRSKGVWTVLGILLNIFSLAILLALPEFPRSSSKEIT